MKNIFLSSSLFLLCFVSALLHAQFDVEAYKKFLEQNKSLTTQQIIDKYDAGRFVSNTNTDCNAAQFFAQVDSKYSLTPTEKELINKHSFMVTERVSFPSFSAGFYDVYTNDLPVYISSDAILHALHRSYDNMLADVERTYLSYQLKASIKLMHSRLSAIARNASLDSLIC